MVKNIISKFKVNKKNTVLDIGCNDGVLLQHYPKNFEHVIGIEPSDASKQIKQKRIKLIKSFFNYKTSKIYLKKNKKPKIITITNVMAQIENIKELAKSLKNISDKESVIIIEFPYLLHMINRGLFDLIYHEHLSYFALTPLKFLFENYEIKIIDYQKLDMGASGPAIRLFLAKNNSIYKTQKKVNKQVLYEKNWGIKKINKYLLFEKKVRIKQNFKIGCYTASSKGNTLLNCIDIDKNKIEFASENNKKKIGKFTPGTHIKIISDKLFLQKKIDYAILLSWNYKNFFLKKSLFYKKGGKFIIPLPTPHIR